VSPPILEIVNLTKRFGTLTALNEVSMTLKPGTFHALLGENGAGKSTLVKCVMGFHWPTAGEVKLDGRRCAIASPRVAQTLGIGMVYQHFNSISAMTVAENLLLSRGGKVVIDWKAEQRSLARFMQTAPFQLPLDAIAGQLSAGEQQKLEILKQLYLQSKILILDEPTSVLTPQEADEILGLLRQSVRSGDLSVLLISHKLREVMAFADEITVLRRGRVAGQGYVHDLSISEITTLMIGEQHAAVTVDKVQFNTSNVVLEMQSIRINKDNNLPAVLGIDLRVHQGEIVGIAGVSGNGQREWVEALAGVRSLVAGQVFVNGDRYCATRAEMVRHGVFVLPEEPLKQACVPQMSVGENLALRTFDRKPQAEQGWLIWREIWAAARSLIAAFNIQTPSPQTPVEQLSGGNVQRTVLARELSSPQIQLLIAANPCSGLDFAAVEEIHRQILQARNRGVAVLLVSEDLEELLKLSDRILVMNGGRLVYERPIAQAEFTEIGCYMTN
jgi:simple sugar transport system ATP-binding protein